VAPGACHWIVRVIARSVCLDGLQQVACASIVQEEEALANSPERCGAEHVTFGESLSDVIGQGAPHVMDEQIGIEMSLLVLQRFGFIARTGHHGGGVAKEAPNSRIAETCSEQLLASLCARRTARELYRRAEAANRRLGRAVFLGWSSPNPRRWADSAFKAHGAMTAACHIRTPAMPRQSFAPPRSSPRTSSWLRARFAPRGTVRLTHDPRARAHLRPPCQGECSTVRKVGHRGPMVLLPC